MQQYQPQYYVETKNGLVEVCKAVYDAHIGRKVIA
jgi:metal-sulfur cluster biosynthetic enzyme